MTDHDEDLSALSTLKSLHTNAVRAYYTYAYLGRLLRSQEKSFWEDLSTLLGIAASVVTIVAVIQNPPSFPFVLLAYGIAILLIGAPTILWRRRRENGLDDVVYLGIYLDETANFVSEVELARSYRKSKAIEAFLEDRQDALRVTLTYLKGKISKLKATHEYPQCLSRVGRTETWVQNLNNRVKSILGSGFIDQP